MRAGLYSILAAACVLCAAGCSGGEGFGRGDARQGGSITVALAERPDSLDPAVAASSSALEVLWLTHLAPVTYARAEGAGGTALEPGLAEKMPETSKDGLVVTFTFRRGLRYSNGRGLRAGDFERAVKRAVLLSVRGLDEFGRVAGVRAFARRGDAASDIPGIKANDRTRRVRIALIAPDPELPAVLASPRAAPVPAGTPARELRKAPPGIGPYRVSPVPGRAAFLLERRLEFRLPGVPGGNLDEIAGQVVTDPARRARDAIGGRVDAVQGEPPLGRLVEIRSKYKDRYEEQPTLALDYVAIDPRRAPFDNKDLRRAVALSLDEAALRRIRDGFLDPTCNLLPPQVVGYRRLDPCPLGDPGKDPDLVLAADLVAKAPQPPPRVLVAAGSDRGGRALARYLAETLVKIGFHARPARTARERRRAQVSFRRRLPAIPSPVRYLDAAADPALRSRIALVELGGDPRKSAPEWAALDREAVDDAQIVPYGVETTGVLLSKRLDARNCSRFHPVYGLDLSSLCLR